MECTGLFMVIVALIAAGTSMSILGNMGEFEDVCMVGHT